MSRRLTKELVLRWLKEAAGWEAGHNELFEYKHWSLGIHKEDDSYQPFTFGVAGHHKGTAEIICRRYRSIEEAIFMDSKSLATGSRTTVSTCTSFSTAARAGRRKDRLKHE